MLTDDEKRVGRAFRSAAQAHLLWLNATSPPTYFRPAFLAIARHNCVQKGGVSVAMQLKEVYLRSAEVIPDYCQLGFDDYEPVAWIGGTDRFGFLWRDGTCKSCGETSRSKAGRLVDAVERPPLDGKVSR